MIGVKLIGFSAWETTMFLRIIKRIEKNPTLTRTLHCKLKTHGHQVFVKNAHTNTATNPMKVLFFGNDDFALETLKSLCDKYASQSLSRLEVVTSSTNKKNTIKDYATEQELKIHEWPIGNEVSNFDIGVVASFGHLIPSKIINSFPLGMINIHASLLPRWRGAAPIQHAILNDDKKTGITLMKIMPKRIDVGNILIQKETKIGSDETAVELRSRLAVLGANLLTESWEQLPILIKSAKPQNDADATCAPKITIGNAKIRVKTMTAVQVYNLHRAISDQYTLHTLFKGQKIKLSGIRIITPNLTPQLKIAAPGYVTHCKKNNALIVKCTNGWIAVEEVVPLGRTRMSAKSFYNGYLGALRIDHTFFE